MKRTGQILVVVLVAAAVAGVAVAAIKARQMREVADETADDIEAQLDALDPVTRAAVVGKLSKDAMSEAVG
jgi:hypothetical protein